MARPPKDPVDRFRQALDKGGLSGLERAIQRVQKQAEAAQKPFAALAATMDDPRIRRAAGQALAVEDATRKLNSQARERLALESRRQSVLTGSYAAEPRANQLITKERERVEAMERRAQFGVKYGRFGGLMYAADRIRNDPLARAGMTVAAGVGGAATAAAMRGFSGTVEWNRLQLEVNLVSKELAGAFLPAIQVVTRGLQSLRAMLERLSVRQQNLLMLGGLVFGGLATMGLARMGLAGLMGGLGAGASAAGAAGAGAAGAGLLSRVGMVGAVGAGALAAGTIGNNPFLGIGGGAALGFRFGGPVGALAGATLGAATSAPADRAGERPSDYYGRMRREGRSMVGAALTTGGRAIARVFGADPEPAGGDAGPNSGRRRVTIADAGFEESGIARGRMINSLALVDAARAGAETRTVEQQILDFLKETFGVGRAPPPPSL